LETKVILWPIHSVQETSPNFLRRPTRVDNTADNADITQSQAANHHRLLCHVTLGRPRRMQEANSLCTDSRALRAEYCIVCTPRNIAIWFTLSHVKHALHATGPPIGAHSVLMPSAVECMFV